MGCGAVSTSHIPEAEHKALHECSCLKAQVSNIEKGRDREHTRKDASHYDQGHASGLCGTIACIIDKKSGSVCVHTREPYVPRI